MNILYISRRYPPSVGGMEKLAYEVYSRISRKEHVELLAWGGSNKWLPLVIPYYLLESIFILLTKKIDIIHIGDGSITPLWLILGLFRKPFAVTIHALDITYSNRLYQFLIPWCVRRMDRVICLSDYTKEECLKRGVLGSKLAVVPCGISDVFYMKDGNASDLKKILESGLSISFANKKIILSVGRFVKRKGFYWFIDKALPEILKRNKDFIYIAAGDGVERKQVAELVREKGLSDYVHLPGKVDEETLKLLYNVADIFVMPNVLVKGDTEGFGIVALEASSCSLPVVASNIEGIKDALKDYGNAFLLPPFDAAKYADTIIKLLENDSERKKIGKEARRLIIENYNWNTISDRYLREIKSAAGARQVS